MATREDIIRGLELVVQEAKRSAGVFADGHWDRLVPGGWTVKQLYAHLAEVADIVPGFAGMLAQAPQDTALLKTIDIDSMNDQGVQARAGKSPEELVADVVKGYEALIGFAKQAPQELLDSTARFWADPMPISDVMATAVVLHGLHHIYEAASAT
jgi:hypothetical protein